MEQPLIEMQPQAPVVSFNLMPVVVRLVKGRGVIFWSAMAGLLLGVAASLVIRPWYKASAEFLPPKQPMDGTMSQSMSLFSGTSETSDLYLGMLQSRALTDDVIDHLNLMQVYKAKLRDTARTTLAANSLFEVQKNSIITVTVKASTPELAAKIANEYTNALYRLNGSMAASGSAYRTAFLEQQLQFQKEQLSQADVALKKTEERTGVMLPTGEAEANISSTLQLQNEINMQESRLAGLRVSETEQNPEVKQTETALANLQAALAARRSSERGGAGLTSNAKLPEMVLENAERAREVRLREGIYEALTAQYEKTRAAALDPGPQLQIISQALPPEQKSGPPRRLLAIGGLLLGALLSLMYLVLSVPLRNVISEFRRVYVQES